MTAQQYTYDWSNLAFGSKKPIKELQAIFIAAPRELSEKRLKEIVKTYLPQGNIVLGISKEPYVDGFEAQPQFKMLRIENALHIVELVNRRSAHKIITLSYFQRELPHLLEKLQFKKVVLVRGSWQHSFHLSPAFYVLTGSHIPFEYISPFASEQEAHEYERDISKLFLAWTGKQHREVFTEAGAMNIAAKVASFSYDYSFQTGAVLAKRLENSKGPRKYHVITGTFNRVVPFQTYAMHYGASREENFSPPHDLNHYDTIHAEVALLIEAQKTKQDLHGTTLFINLMPCPACARMLSQTDIEEFVYSIDHSDGYAVKMLEAAGKKVRRVVL